MFSNEVLPMAVKKSTAPKGGAKKKAAVKKTATKKTATKKASPKKGAKKAPKAGAKKAAPKKAAGVKLTDNQKTLLKQVVDFMAVGMLATKANAKNLAALQSKKLIKKIGKAEGGFNRYVATTLGKKHAPAPAAATTEPSTTPAM
jgi:hypothetical protein